MFDPMGLFEVTSVSRNWIAGRFGVGLSPQNHPLKSAKNRGKKIGFYLCKWAKAKTMSYRTLGFPEYGITNASNFKYGLPLTATPKGVIQKWAIKLAFIYVKVPRQKNSVIAYLIVFSKYRMTNASISSMALPLTATQIWIKKRRVTKFVLIYVK